MITSLFLVAIGQSQRFDRAAEGEIGKRLKKNEDEAQRFFWAICVLLRMIALGSGYLHLAFTCPNSGSILFTGPRHSL